MAWHRTVFSPALVQGFLSLFSLVQAEVSIYDYPVPRPTPGYVYQGWQAYDPAQPLSDPPLPADGTVPLDFTVQLDTTGSATGAGNPVPGAFLGISIEMSLAEAISELIPTLVPLIVALTSVFSTWLRPQFLNLMSTVKERGGPPVLRVGGNTQEKAALVDSLPGGAATKKIVFGPSSFTNTPTLIYTPGILEAMRAASEILGIKWFLGIPMNQTCVGETPPRLEIVEKGESIIGDYLWGWQLGNEPDLYLGHGYRTAPYEAANYMDEFQSIINAINSNPNIKNKNKLGGPAVCCTWTTDQLIDLGYFTRFGNSLNALIIEQYPDQNCPGLPHDPQTTMNNFMNHGAAVSFRGKYEKSTQSALAAGKPVVLLETNTASCNGFIGISDAFASALWATDMAMQLASGSWTHMMLHLGGQAAYYNPFVPPPHNASAPFMWTVGPPMYAILAVAEALGDSNNARVADLGANQNNGMTPAYVVYENNQPVRVLFINYMSDPSGGHDYVARIQTDAAQVRVRHMRVDGDQVTKKANVTWAGQSFGGYFESDGLLRGEHQTETIPCSNGLCSINVQGPSVALVFLTDASYQPDDKIQTFASTHTTAMRNTAAVDGLTLHTGLGLNAAQRLAMAGSGTSRQKKVTNPAYPSPRPELGFVVLASLLILSVAFA
ncbi:hypothetical protein EXIGLDRAFT_776006 [Exidia glandulosa HHB12029]|uniref:Beta-glucuronidase C-terminal domain-containing protein n=1 Tax=Exidia glandulosa HHB12029 TaxID=1314781 RepID=A0A165DN41_EXIGL|nr:hypothetical protein EXIGLDRAFT_776006 [Exidia glandulosa HHB12029]